MNDTGSLPSVVFLNCWVFIDSTAVKFHFLPGRFHNSAVFLLTERNLTRAKAHQRSCLAYQLLLTRSVDIADDVVVVDDVENPAAVGDYC